MILALLAVPDVAVAALVAAALDRDPTWRKLEGGGLRRR
jgi:hypothetical protein